MSDRFDDLEYDDLEEIESSIKKKNNLSLRRVLQWMIDNNLESISIQDKGIKRPDGYNNIKYRRVFFDKITS